MSKNRFKYETAKFFHPIVAGIIVGVFDVGIGEYTGNWLIAFIPFVTAVIGIIVGSRGHMDKWK